MLAPSLVRKLRPTCLGAKKPKQKPYCSKFNKVLKIAHIKKKKKETLLKEKREEDHVRNIALTTDRVEESGSPGLEEFEEQILLRVQSNLNSPLSLGL